MIRRPTIGQAVLFEYGGQWSQGTVLATKGLFAVVQDHYFQTIDVKHRFPWWRLWPLSATAPTDDQPEANDGTIGPAGTALNESGT